MRLVNSNEDKLRMIFEEVEEILGFRLPRPPASIGHGGQTRELAAVILTRLHGQPQAGRLRTVDTETLVFVRKNPIHRPWTDRSKIDLEAFHVHHAELLQKDATFSREEIYEDRV